VHPWALWALDGQLKREWEAVAMRQCIGTLAELERQRQRAHAGLATPTPVGFGVRSTGKEYKGYKTDNVDPLLPWAATGHRVPLSGQ